MTIEKTNSPTIDINTLRHEVTAKAFEEAAGSRVLILTPEFPFLIIGRIVKSEGDFVFINAETTNIDEFEGSAIRIHIDRIMVFYIETREYPIPRIRPSGGPQEWGDAK